MPSPPSDVLSGKNDSLTEKQLSLSECLIYSFSYEISETDHQLDQLEKYKWHAHSFGSLLNGPGHSFL